MAVTILQTFSARYHYLISVSCQVVIGNKMYTCDMFTSEFKMYHTSGNFYWYITTKCHKLNFQGVLILSYMKLKQMKI